MSDAGIHLLVGTTKGAFVIDGGADRTGWTVRGPFCGGWTINHVVADPEPADVGELRVVVDGAAVDVVRHRVEEQRHEEQRHQREDAELDNGGTHQRPPPGQLPPGRPW